MALKDHLVTLPDGTIMNLNQLVNVRSYDDGSIRLFCSSSTETYWEYEGDAAKAVLDFFKANSQRIGG